MKILFLVYHGFSDVSGISKKIHYQVKGLRENGHDVWLCYYDRDERGHMCRMVSKKQEDGSEQVTVLNDYGTGLVAGLRQRVGYDALVRFCQKEGIEMVYARCFQNASPMLISLFRRLRKQGARCVTEIPTYPYDNEFRTFPWHIRTKLAIDRMFRRQLAQQMVAMVTFSDAEEIFGQRTIRISNGVDFDSIPLHTPPPYPQEDSEAIHLIGVAEVHIWHGYDRVIRGLGEYYRQQSDGEAAKRKKDVVFHIVGGVHDHDMNVGTDYYPSFRSMIEEYGIEQRVVFHGQLFGQELDKVFAQCHFAIGSLARHRSGITVIKTLKNREYATRGIPFIYSEQDSDFDNQPYVMKAPADESPIDIGSIVDFVATNQPQPEKIRKTVENLSWKIQMAKVVEEMARNE